MSTGKTRRESYIRLKGGSWEEVKKRRETGRDLVTVTCSFLVSVWAPEHSLWCCASFWGCISLAENSRSLCLWAPEGLPLSAQPWLQHRRHGLLAIHRCFNFSVFACQRESRAIETKIHSYLFMYFSRLYICVLCVCTHIIMCVEVRRQLRRVPSLTLLWRFWGLSPGHEGWWQGP